MKNKTIAIFILSFVALIFIVADADAIRGGGGGGRGGGGGGRGGFQGGRGDFNRGDINRGDLNRGDFNRNDISRTPTMSRANTWSPNTSSFQREAPTASNLLSQARPQTNMTSGQSRQQLQQFIGQGAGRDIQGAQGGLGTAAAAARPDLSNLGTSASQVRQGLDRNFPNRGNWFNNQFFRDHNYSPLYGAAARNWWDNASWATLGAYAGLAGTAPLYYDNGYGYPVSSVDYGSSYSQPSQTYNVYQAPSYSQGTQQQYSGTATATATNSDWLPLGVFAVTSSVNSETQPVMFFQLALSKDGTIAGTYYNQAMDKAFPVDGLVDKSTQKAVWKMSQGQNSPIFETGIYNLTLPESSVSVNFGNQNQNWMLVRSTPK